MATTMTAAEQTTTATTAARVRSATAAATVASRSARATAATVAGKGLAAVTAQQGETDDREEDRDAKNQHSIHANLPQTIRFGIPNTVRIAPPRLGRILRVKGDFRRGTLSLSSAVSLVFQAQSVRAFAGYVDWI
jgi:hypothetical protein